MASKPKLEECSLCGRTEYYTEFSEMGGICDDCMDDANDDPSWGAHEDAY